MYQFPKLCRTRTPPSYPRPTSSGTVKVLLPLPLLLPPEPLLGPDELGPVAAAAAVATAATEAAVAAAEAAAAIAAAVAVVAAEPAGVSQLLTLLQLPPPLPLALASEPALICGTFSVLV